MSHLQIVCLCLRWK